MADESDSENDLEAESEPETVATTSHPGSSAGRAVVLPVAALVVAAAALGLAGWSVVSPAVD